MGFVWLICVLLKFFFFALLIIQQIREGWVVLSEKIIIMRDTQKS